MDDGEVRIIRSERLRIPRERDKTRIAKLKAYKTRIIDWAEPSTIVYDEPIIVTIKARGIERTVDHPYSDVTRFEDLLSQKKLAGYKISARDGVIAYLLVRGHGGRRLITGFLNSKYKDGTPSFPDLINITDKTVVKYLSRLKAEGWTT